MDNRNFHIVVAESYSDDVLSRLAEAGRVTVLKACDEATLRRAMVDCDALLVRTYAQMTRSVLEAGKKLKVVGRGGVGVDNIDVEAATSLGIQVVYTPCAATDAVAELTIGMMISLVRELPRSDRAVRAGQFFECRSSLKCAELGDLVLGIVGLGRIGRAVARRCQVGLGMTVVYNDIADPGHLDFAASAVSKESLYGQSDVVSLHVPLTTTTSRLIDGVALSKFKPGAFLLNTSRGGVVDSLAVAKAVEDGGLGGAGLDVFEPEPLPEGHPLLSQSRVILTPHSGARTRAALTRMGDVADDVVRVLHGLPPVYSA